MRPQHIYSRGLLGLGLLREDAPNPQETGGPREFRGLLGCGWEVGTSLWRQGGEKVFDVEESEGGWCVGNKIWTVNKQTNKQKTNKLNTILLREGRTRAYLNQTKTKVQ